MFHCAAIDALLVNDAVVDAAFTVQIDEWRGRRSVKAMLETVAPARSCCALEACLDPDAVSFTADLFAEAEGEPDLAAADEAPSRRCRSGAPPRPVGGDGPARPGRPGGGHCEGHHRRPPAASGPARDSRSAAGGEVHLRRHGHGARQVAVLPNLRRLPRADRPCREPVHLPLAGAHRRPGVPSAGEPRALRYRERRHHRRVDARGARGGVRGAGRREPRYRAHHAGVPHVPHRRAGGLGARRVRRRGRGAPHRTGQGPASAWPTPSSTGR